MAKLLANFGDVKSTAIGILMIVALLPQSEAIQQLMSISPKVAGYIVTIGGIAASALAIFGISTKKQ